MIRDIRWAYELGFKRGWKVGNRRGRNALKPLIQPDLIKGFSSGTISCDTESTEERKFSDLETKVKQSDIRASAISDTLPEYKCNVHQDFADALAMNHFALSFCPKCGEKL